MRYSALLTRPPKIPNRAFRRALLSLNGLAPFPEDDPLPQPTTRSKPEWVDGMVRRLGFVQVDSVSAVERAQHHILFSRNLRYRRRWLDQRVAEARTLFENWTHDAAILPSEVYPYWRHYFDRFKNYECHSGYRRYFSGVSPEELDHVLGRIREEGPLKPRDFDPAKVKFSWAGVADGGFPLPTVAKVAMEYLWRVGTLAVSRRDKREKVYDLAERVIPDEYRSAKVTRSKYRDWACREALTRLGAATPAQIARFTHAVSTEEATQWCRRELDQMVVQLRVEFADRTSSTAPTYALAADVERLHSAPAPTRRLRLLNPFDPLIHDRQRTSRIFGFDYALEIFVPAKKRKYGYYVLPILEGERFTGRIDVKADRKSGELRVLALYWEQGVRPIPRRLEQLERELSRLGRFCGTPAVVHARLR